MDENDTKEGKKEVSKDDITCYSYIVTPRNGINLQDLFNEKKKFSRMLVYSLGIQIINILEQIHSAGFVFNDLKPDNLMLDHDAPLDDKTLSCNEANETIFGVPGINAKQRFREILNQRKLPQIIKKLDL